MRRGDIWLINLDPTIGAEIRKKRPCVILNNDAVGALPLRIIAPVTSFKQKYSIVPWMVKLTPDSMNGLKKNSVIDVFQVRSVSIRRFVEKIGEIKERDLRKCEEALGIVFSI